MKPLARRFSFAEDCLLAAFVSAIAYIILLAFARDFSWPALLGLLIVPIALLATYRRYRAASLCAAVATVAGAWDVVPPARSFALDLRGVAALVTFAVAASVAIALSAWANRRIVSHAPHSNA